MRNTSAILAEAIRKARPYMEPDPVQVIDMAEPSPPTLFERVRDKYLHLKRQRLGDVQSSQIE